MASLILTPPAPAASAPSWNITQTTVKLSKPSALIFARFPAVQVTRTRSDFFLPSGALRPALARGIATSSSVASSRPEDANSGPAWSEAGSESTAATDVEGANGLHTVVVAVGTNMGQRVQNISNALKELERGEEGKTRVVDTSFLYESDAMYVTDQAKFLNAVVKVRLPVLAFRLKALRTNS